MKKVFHVGIRWNAFYTSILINEIAKKKLKKNFQV